MNFKFGKKCFQKTIKMLFRQLLKEMDVNRVIEEEKPGFHGEGYR